MKCPHCPTYVNVDITQGVDREGRTVYRCNRCRTIWRGGSHGRPPRLVKYRQTCRFDVRAAGQADERSRRFIWDIDTNDPIEAKRWAKIITPPRRRQ
jgi:hypothetical protein